MDALFQLYAAHPFWVWMALAAIFLAVEVPTGSGYLLWPALAAALTALLTGLRLGLPTELLIFAALTMASILLARRYLPHPFQLKGPDINDPNPRLVGHHGQATQDFAGGRGRVFVDGKEWAAELDGGGELARGAEVKVTGILTGACLKVRAG